MRKSITVAERQSKGNKQTDLQGLLILKLEPQ